MSSSGAATTASRLGQPDLAIATLNDFVKVSLASLVQSPLTNLDFFMLGGPNPL
jgi:hypothetical protein